MSRSSYVPLSVSAKTAEALSRKISALQVAQNGKISIISIYWDGKNHICWYYPVRNLGGGLM